MTSQCLRMKERLPESCWAPQKKLRMFGMEEARAQIKMRLLCRTHGSTWMVSGTATVPRMQLVRYTKQAILQSKILD